MDKNKTKLDFASLQDDISIKADYVVNKNIDPNPVKRNSKLVISEELDRMLRHTGLYWLHSLNNCDPGERIITEFNRKGESVIIVVDCNGKFIRLGN